nr:long-chain fatty acid--CoA ligase [Magnetospirillum sulfuroxidans]
MRRPDFSQSQAARERWLAPELAALTRHHLTHCPEYGRWVRAMFGPAGDWPRLEDLPWLPVGVFKTHSPISVPETDIVAAVTSSGTGGQPSRVRLDRATADAQVRALAGIMARLTGGARLPLLILDSEAVLAQGSAYSARAAGILGMMRLGRDAVFALDGEMALRTEAVTAFLRRWGEGPMLVFGFTYMVWAHALPALVAAGLRLSAAALLVHGGGWKALADQAVDNATFKRRLAEEIGVRRVHSYYGMAEQVGGICLEGEDGFLHPPPFVDILIRDPLTLAPLPPGRPGLIQIMSLLPRSYPGHSLLTEDMGMIETIDTGVWGGKAFSVLGRLKQAELRGCSDTFAARGPA